MFATFIGDDKPLLDRRNPVNSNITHFGQDGTLERPTNAWNKMDSVGEMRRRPGVLSIRLGEDLVNHLMVTNMMLSRII